MKIAATIENAKACLSVTEEFGSFNKYMWDFVGGSPRRNSWQSISEVPAKTEESDAMSKAMKIRGFKFVGSTICYAYMQATGMVNDHTVNCFRYSEV